MIEIKKSPYLRLTNSDKLGFPIFFEMDGFQKIRQFRINDLNIEYILLKPIGETLQTELFYKTNPIPLLRDYIKFLKQTNIIELSNGSYLLICGNRNFENVIYDKETHTFTHTNYFDKFLTLTTSKLFPYHDILEYLYEYKLLKESVLKELELNFTVKEIEEYLDQLPMKEWNIDTTRDEIYTSIKMGATDDESILDSECTLYRMLTGLYRMYIHDSINPQLEKLLLTDRKIAFIKRIK